MLFSFSTLAPLALALVARVAAQSTGTDCARTCFPPVLQIDAAEGPSKCISDGIDLIVSKFDISVKTNLTTTEKQVAEACVCAVDGNSDIHAAAVACVTSTCAADQAKVWEATRALCNGNSHADDVSKNDKDGAGVVSVAAPTLLLSLAAVFLL